MSTELAVIQKIIVVPALKKKRKKEHRGSRGEGSLFQRGKVWWYVTPTGVRYSTSTKVKSEAIDFKLRKLAELNSGDKPHIKSKAPGVTINQLLDLHLEHMQRKKCASVSDVKGVMEVHLRPYFGARLAASLGTEDFQKYRDDKLLDTEGRLCNLDRPGRRGVISETTLNRHLSYIRSGYTAGKRVTPRLVHFIPYFPITDEEGNAREGFLEDEGYLKIRDGLTPSLKPLLVCGYHVGTRKGELLKVRWPQVDLDQKLIILQKRTVKNKTGRALPIYGDMVEVLTEQKKIRDAECPECEYVFFWHAAEVKVSGNFMVKHVGTRIQDFYKTWDRVVKDAGYEGLLFHDLRRSAARNMRKAGMSKDRAKKITGHKTDSMYTRYDIFTEEDVLDGRAELQAFYDAKNVKAQEAVRLKITGHIAPSVGESRHLLSPSSEEMARLAVEAMDWPRELKDAALAGLRSLDAGAGTVASGA